MKKITLTSAYGHPLCLENPMDKGAWRATVNSIAKSQTRQKSIMVMFKLVLAWVTYSRLHTAAAATSLQLCPTLCDPVDGSPSGSPRPWDSPGKNTGVGCHFLLQCMNVKSESEVAQSCSTLSDLMDCSLPGFSVHGIFQARVLEWGAIAFSARLHTSRQ